MFRDKKVIVVMPAYNAARTLQQTHAEVMAQDYVDQVIVVDDGSSHETVAIAKTLPDTVVHVHPRN
jgi:glycosyltransferase involved in cell wall biosynthesis